MGRKCRVNGDTAGMRVVPLPSLPASGQPNTDPGTAKATGEPGVLIIRLLSNAYLIQRRTWRQY